MPVSAGVRSLGSRADKCQAFLFRSELQYLLSCGSSVPCPMSYGGPYHVLRGFSQHSERTPSTPLRKCSCCCGATLQRLLLLLLRPLMVMLSRAAAAAAAAASANFKLCHPTSTIGSPESVIVIIVKQLQLHRSSCDSCAPALHAS